MKIEAELTDEAVLAELGQRLARIRLGRNLTQKDLSADARIGVATVQRLEAGEPVRFPSFVRVLRALGLLDALETLIPAPSPSPIELLELRGERRQRARQPRSRHSDRDEPRRWVWGDEEPDETT